MSRLLALLNSRAGTMHDVGAARIRDALKALERDGRTVEIRMIEPKRIRAELMAAAASDFDTVVIGGGDGSVNCAAGIFAEAGKTLGVLPFGTVNLFARDLGMPAGVEDAIVALHEAQPRRVDLASLNGRPFHSLSGLGFFSQMARAREETRGHPLGRMASVMVAALRAIRRSGRFTIDLEADGRSERVEALAVLVTNNRFGADWRRPRLDAGELEIHIVEDKGALARLKASADLLTGAWRDNPGIRSFTARELIIDRSRQRTWIATDGELARARLPLRYGIRPAALTVLGIADVGPAADDVAAATSAEP